MSFPHAATLPWLSGKKLCFSIHVLSIETFSLLPE